VQGPNAFVAAGRVLGVDLTPLPYFAFRDVTWRGHRLLVSHSGYTGEAAAAQIVWAGDQEASWDEYDGLPTAVTAITGIPYLSPSSTSLARFNSDSFS